MLDENKQQGQDNNNQIQSKEKEKVFTILKFFFAKYLSKYKVVIYCLF
jgi:hypothetical protein